MCNVARVKKAMALMKRWDHPCQMFRLFPWTFPRACECDVPPELKRKGGIEVETRDLLYSCPTWSCTAPDSFPMQPQMRAFRELWSHRKVRIGPPEQAEDDDLTSLAYWGCFTQPIWRVIGPRDFLCGLNAIIGVGKFPEALPWPSRLERCPNSLYLCQHEICGD